MSNKVVTTLIEAQTAIYELCRALDTLESVKETLDGSAINLSDHEAEIAADERISHTTGAVYKFILDDVIPTGVITALKAYYSGTPTQQGFSALMKARKYVR